jgi:hypothetical protein
MRDLVRARATAGRVLSKARQHLQSFLLPQPELSRGSCLDAGLSALADCGCACSSRAADRATLRQCARADGLSRPGAVRTFVSGASIRRGGITKAGNVLARRVLIEGAWTYRMPARVSRKLHDRKREAVAGDPRHRLERPDPAVPALSVARCGGQT